MKTHTASLVALLLAASLPSVAVSVEQRKPEHLTHAKDPMTAQLEPLNGAAFEVGFLANMINHHRSGVEMAKLAIERAKSDRLKEMGSMMVSAQQREIEQMTGWLKEWHNKSPQDHEIPKESMRMMKKDMDELSEKKGEAFDKSFARMMAHHHEGAIQMSVLVPSKTERKELRELADKIQMTQSKERRELQQMAGK
jgi:uncharacterized protein (DUF305 family)